MEFLKTVVKILDTRMQDPPAFGWFHILFLVLSIAFGVLLCVLYKNGVIKKPHKVLLFVAITVIIFEIYKLIILNINSDTLEYKFNWYLFPWQFCSTPMYVGLLAGIFRKGKFHDSLCAFLATYAMFAGICAMILPDNMLIDIVGINIQTMVCHGSMISISIFLFYSNHVKPEPKTILKAIPVFATLMTIAIALNELEELTGFANGESFDMFYIRRGYVSELPYYQDIQALLPHYASLIVYFAVFTIAATIVLLSAWGISLAAKKIKSKKRIEKIQAVAN